MKKSVSFLVLAVALVAVSAGTPAHAGILYDNLGAGSNGGDSISSFGPLADSFSTGGTAASLTDLKLLLLVGDSTDGGSVSVNLFSDSGTSPGGLLANLGTVLDSSLLDHPSVIVPLGSPIALAAGTRYWIQLSSNDGSSADWTWSFDTSGTGVASEFFNNSTGTYTSVDGPYQMQVTAAVTSVPEPATLSLGLMGVAALVIVRRRTSR